MSTIRRRLLDDSYKKTVSGNPAAALGSLARRGPGIVLYGWTEQGSTEGTNLFDIRKISANSQVSVNGEQIEICGVSESGTTAAAAPNTLKDYAPGVKSGETYTLSLQSSSGKNYILLADGTVWGNGKQKNLTEAEINGVVRFYGGGVDGIHVMTGIQIEHGEKATAYEPYTGGAPSPSPGYPQEIASAGEWDGTLQGYKYTVTVSDAETATIRTQTVMLCSARPLTKWDRLEKRDGTWGWVYQDIELTFDGTENWYIYRDGNGFYLNQGLPFADNYREGYMETCMVATENFLGQKGMSVRLGAGNSTLYVGKCLMYDASLEDSGLQGWKDYLAQHPLKILTYGGTETFVPLAETEQQGMEALHTYYPVTILANDAGCRMELTYKTRKNLEAER